MTAFVVQGVKSKQGEERQKLESTWEALATGEELEAGATEHGRRGKRRENGEEQREMEALALQSELHRVWEPLRKEVGKGREEEGEESELFGVGRRGGEERGALGQQ